MERINFFKDNIESVDETDIQFVTILPKSTDFDYARSGFLQDVQNIGINSLSDSRIGKTFFFQGFTPEEIQRVRHEILHEDTHLDFYEGQMNLESVANPSHFVCISYQRQVSNPAIDSLEHAIQRIGIPLERKRVQISEIYLLYGDVSAAERDRIEEMLVNVSIQERLSNPPTSLGVDAVGNDTVELISLRSLLDSELKSMSENRRLFLSLKEMQAIQTHYKKIGREPTDCELEVIAQGWSEHCGHKTFKAEVYMNGEKKQPLYKRLKQSTVEIAHPDVLSCFVDDSGVVRLDDEHGVCIKAETHSAPAAIEPFGGTETGVGGVIRDILGTGLGAKPIAVMDVLCFGDLSLSTENVPPGCLHPNVLLNKCVAGVESYGNKMGLPNISGALYFDNCFSTKPIVLAGSIGLIPIEKAEKGKPQPGDVIICLGGKTGKDGIHGATFSSGEMTDRTKALDSTAVQIGYPVLERQVMDVLAKLFEKNIIHALTDCGGGGLSSAVTEICENLGGTVDLREITTKYQGLKPWELFLSESQERMLIAIPPERAAEVIALCMHYGINADQIGSFGEGDNILTLNYGKKKVAELDLGFVLGGNPQTTIEGEYKEPKFRESSVPHMSQSEIRDLAFEILNDLNVCSRESVVRKYDQVVTGHTQERSFGGKHQDTPQDALLLRPKYDSFKGLMTTHGLAPEIGKHDPYMGSLTSVIEAISNAVARGADLSKIFLIDNFIHPRPDNPEDVGTLDRSLEGAIAGAKAFGTPFVSGKDSLGSTYHSADGTVIKANPMIIVTALSVLDDIERTVPSHFQKIGSQIVLLGDSGPSKLGGSVVAKKLGLDTNAVPQYDLDALKKTFVQLHKLIKENQVLSCHDIKEGGIFTTIAEMMFGNERGVQIDLSNIDAGSLIGFLYNEKAGRFIVEVSADRDIETLFNGMSYTILGKTHKGKNLNLRLSRDEARMCLRMEDMKDAYHNSQLEAVLKLDRESSSIKTAKPITPSRARRTASKVQPEVLIVKAPGTNSEQETAQSFEVAGARSRIVDIVDLTLQQLKNAQILALPGGFSYGDDLGAGKIFSLDLLHKFGDGLHEFVYDDKLVLGICNGFQVLARTGLLPNKKIGELECNLLHNEAGHFVCRDVELLVEDSVCRWTEGIQGARVRVPIAHGEGRFFTSSSTLETIESGKQVAFRYADSNGQATQKRPYNPNGSLNSIAGITDPNGKILGMMPHPERDHRNFFRKKLKDVIGLDIIQGGVQYFE